MSEPLRERVAREPRTRTGSFCFSTSESRDAFGSRVYHIKRQMSFYGCHCHPGTACRESPVSYARTFLVADESFLLRHGRLIKILNDTPLFVCATKSKTKNPLCDACSLTFRVNSAFKTNKELFLRFSIPPIKENLQLSLHISFIHRE